jgi:hypothetical protein
LQGTLSFDLDQADAAGAFRWQGRVVAQDRDIDPGLLGDLQDRLAGLSLYFATVDG